MGRVCFVRPGRAVGSIVKWLEMFRMGCEIKSGFDVKHSNHSLQSPVYRKLHDMSEITAEHRYSLHCLDINCSSPLSPSNFLRLM
jgi:hypothetical protein